VGVALSSPKPQTEEEPTVAKIEQSIDVNVPVRVAYDQWTQFESFPQFMEGVESVQQVDDTHMHWVATIAGKRQEWDAEVSEQRPDNRVAWHATSGDQNAGAVDFHRLSDDQTRITLTMEVEPSGALEKIGTALGITESHVKGDLERFKSFIEERQSPTGAWRGEVDGGQVTGEGSSSGSGSFGMGSSTTSDRELAGTGTMGATGTGTSSDLGTSGATGSGADFQTGGGTSSDLGAGLGTGSTSSGLGGDLGGGSFGTGTGSDLGGGTSSTASDQYGAGGSSTVYDTGTESGMSGTGGQTGTGLANDQDLGTGARTEDRDL